MVLTSCHGSPCICPSNPTGYPDCFVIPGWSVFVLVTIVLMAIFGLYVRSVFFLCWLNPKRDVRLSGIAWKVEGADKCHVFFNLRNLRARPLAVKVSMVVDRSERVEVTGGELIDRDVIITQKDLNVNLAESEYRSFDEILPFGTEKVSKADVRVIEVR